MQGHVVIYTNIILREDMVFICLLKILIIHHLDNVGPNVHISVQKVNNCLVMCIVLKEEYL